MFRLHLQVTTLNPLQTAGKQFGWWTSGALLFERTTKVASCQVEHPIVDKHGNKHISLISHIYIYSPTYSLFMLFHPRGINRWQIQMILPDVTNQRQDLGASRWLTSHNIPSHICPKMHPWKNLIQTRPKNHQKSQSKNIRCLGNSIRSFSWGNMELDSSKRHPKCIIQPGLETIGDPGESGCRLRHGANKTWDREQGSAPYFAKLV